ncbi:MAG: pyridoxamine 5'-phosphate oxidase family protein [Actinomycetota bacterium]|nr:pyridoxamine 5'-phosphate oxidase family protein [Actinomycetota bacterium]
MASWQEFEAAAPEMAAEVRKRFDAHTHKTIATLRKDGSPRISGTETNFAEGELWIGAMWESRKALDLRRDPRFALHSGSDDPPEWEGDAKIEGVAEEILDEETVRRLNGSEVGKSHLFRLEIRSAATVGLTEDRKRLRVRSWNLERGVRTLERD